MKPKQDMVNEIIALYNADIQEFKKELESQDYVSVWETYVKHDLSESIAMGDHPEPPKSVEPPNFKKAITAFLLGFGVVTCAFMCYHLFSAMGEWLAVSFK